MDVHATCDPLIGTAARVGEDDGMELHASQSLRPHCLGCVPQPETLESNPMVTLWLTLSRRLIQRYLKAKKAPVSARC